MTQISHHIHINGIVQGVGFRPFIYNLAEEYHLTGWIRNSASGVDIEVTGAEDNLAAFEEAIPRLSPPLAQIDTIETRKINPDYFPDFKIVTSHSAYNDFIPVSPDVAICPQCSAELFNPEDRRFRYPFINCTNCGPRFSIIKDIPYDRPNTTMADFEMCPDCLAEYQNPHNRRFHAQPVACPVCGPQIWLENSQGEVLSREDSALKQAQRMLANGKILAIKGLGGFHLACDATSSEAVKKLRERKKRPAKPFALMAFDLERIGRIADVSPGAQRLLSSPQAPIVLMPAKSPIPIAPEVAPGQHNLGIMLPYTPLHQLLLEPAGDNPEFLVMTSGNLAEEPIIQENATAREKLSGIVDGYLLHNRPIHMRIDDSVFALIQDKPYPIRRARGYAPNPIRLAAPLPQILATGPQMKNTFCLTRDKYAFISHYIGEMENWETYQDYQKAIQYYEALFRIHPEAIGYDLHPDYIATKYALERASRENIPAIPVQHHHAHLAAVSIENHLDPEELVAGLIFDGTGYGSDGSIWGGEVLLGNCLDFKRIYHLQPVPLPGGDVSIRKPARMALSTLWAYDLPWSPDLAPVQALSTIERNVLKTQLEKGINTPMTSSMGRLFDAVSALIGIREIVSYEAQAAIELEALALSDNVGYYPWQIDGEQINIKPMLESIIADLVKGEKTPAISARFHETIAQLSLALALRLRQEVNVQNIALSGGVWQNQLLLERTLFLMNQHAIQPLIHHQLPPNDGCVAFGQALVAAYQYLNPKE